MLEAPREQQPQAEYGQTSLKLASDYSQVYQTFSLGRTINFSFKFAIRY